MANDGLNIDFGEMYAFDMVDGDKTVGQMNVSVHRQKTSSRGESQIYPDSWFIGDTEQLKPVLEIKHGSFFSFDFDSKTMSFSNFKF